MTIERITFATVIIILEIMIIIKKTLKINMV